MRMRAGAEPRGSLQRPVKNKKDGEGAAMRADAQVNAGAGPRAPKQASGGTRLDRRGYESGRVVLCGSVRRFTQALDQAHQTGAREEKLWGRL